MAQRTASVFESTKRMALSVRYMQCVMDQNDSSDLMRLLTSDEPEAQQIDTTAVLADIVPPVPVTLDQPETAQQETESALTDNTKAETADDPRVLSEAAKAPQDRQRLADAGSAVASADVHGHKTFRVRGVAFHVIKAVFALISEHFHKLLFPEDGSVVSQVDIVTVEPLL